MSEAFFCPRCGKPSASAICPGCGLAAAPAGLAAAPAGLAAAPAGLAAAPAGSGPEGQTAAFFPPAPFPPAIPVTASPAASVAAAPAVPPTGALPPVVPPPLPPLPSGPHPAAPPAPVQAAPVQATPVQPVPPAAVPLPTGLAATPEAAQVAEYLADGFQIFLVAGIGGTGKTHLMETFRGQDQLGRVQDVDGFLMPTRPGGFDVYPFPHGKRRAIFVDASGEMYRDLYAVTDRTQDKLEIQLLQVVSQGLGGLILLLKLQDLWDPASEGGKQPRVLANLLRLLRWLRGGGRPEAGGQRSLPQRVDAEVERMPRLRVPVLLLMSQADRLHGHELPLPRHAPWAERPGRKIYPAGEEPILLLHHYAPEVLAALEKHVHHFHVDFSHSVVTDPETGKLVAESSCGVELAREWLLRASARPPRLPTAFWLGLDRRLRGGHWSALPPSRPLGNPGDAP